MIIQKHVDKVKNLHYDVKRFYLYGQTKNIIEEVQETCTEL